MQTPGLHFNCFCTNKEHKEHTGHPCWCAVHGELPPTEEFQKYKEEIVEDFMVSQKKELLTKLLVRVHIMEAETTAETSDFEQGFTEAKRIIGRLLKDEFLEL